jgi:hypothetical protein
MMRAATSAALAIFLALTASHAQQRQNDAPTNTNVTTLIPGADEASLAGSAKASKLIGSNVYKGDTSIGAIEDLLVDLAHGALKHLYSLCVASLASAISSSRYRSAKSSSEQRQNSRRS